ncbi:MAG: dTMP kinase [Clostridiales bacterium]|nr:dTMP kinase [Clostridiales bacterium]
MKGKFITFEGCEGAGKSTQIKMLSSYLEKEGIPFVLTREPGGNAISEKIRNIILDSKNDKMTSECEALLYASARAQNLVDFVLPHLEKGEMVLCDRYIDSSLAYQGYARELGFDFVEKINDFAFKNFMPDLTIFFNISPKDAFLRKGGADKGDRLEQMGLTFHQKVYEGYLEILKRYPDRVKAVDCSKDRYTTHQNIIDLLKKEKFI